MRALLPIPAQLERFIRMPGKDVRFIPLEEMLAHHGLRIGLRHARKHLGWALDAAAASAGVAVDTLKRWRTNVLTSEDPAAARSRLTEAFHAFGAAR